MENIIIQLYKRLQCIQVFYFIIIFYPNNNIGSKTPFILLLYNGSFYIQHFFLSFLSIVCLNNSLYFIGSPKQTNTNLGSGLISPRENLNVSQKETHPKNSNDRKFGLSSIANEPGIILFTEI